MAECSRVKNLPAQFAAALLLRSASSSAPVAQPGCSNSFSCTSVIVSTGLSSIMDSSRENRKIVEIAKELGENQKRM